MDSQNTLYHCTSEKCEKKKDCVMYERYLEAKKKNKLFVNLHINHNACIKYGYRNFQIKEKSDD